jgi:DNA-binding beta-propeller fold protein YncE
LSDVNAQWLETSIRVGGGPGELMYVPSVNKVYCVNDNPTAVSIIDCATNAVRATVAMPGSSVPLTWSDEYNRVYFGSEAPTCPSSDNRQGDQIVVIDAVGDTVVASLPCAASPASAAYCGALGKLYVMCIGDGSAIEVIDAARDSIVKRISVPLYAEGIGWCPTTNMVFFANDRGDSMRVIDCSNDQVRALRAGYSAFDQVRWNRVDGRVYTSKEYAVYVFSASGDSLIDSILHPAYTPGMCFAPYPNKCFVGDFGTGTTYVVDCNTESIVDSIQTDQVYATVLDSICGRIYVTHPRDGVTVLDARGDSVVKFVPVTDYPSRSIAWSPRERRVYVAGYYTDTVYVIKDTTLGIAESVKPRALGRGLAATVIRNLPQGAVAFDAMGRRVAAPRTGVFFVREAQAQAQAVRKVVIAR